MSLRGLLLALLVFAVPAVAHESRPAYLQLRQLDAETWDVLWKVPGLAEDRRLSLDPEFAGGTQVVAPVRTTFARNAFVQSWQVRRAGGLEGTSIRIAGLEATLTDALVRLERLDGTEQTLRVLPADPRFTIDAQPDRWDVTRTYLVLGVEHILSGLDHLLFVLALVLLVRGARRLLWAVTAFTAAHSLTLGLSALGLLALRSPPVEASIALSIVFLASEIVRGRTGRPGLTQRSPWLVAFAFGLLHGLGFAGALSEAGLPAHAVPLALLFFNVGVEIGQVMFIAAVLVALGAARRLRLPKHELAWRLPVYAIGTVAAYWTIDRIASF